MSNDNISILQDGDIRKLIWQHCMNIPWCNIKAEITKIDNDVKDLEEQIERLKELKCLITYIKTRRLVTFRSDAFLLIRQGILLAQAERPIPTSKKNTFNFS